MNRNPFMQRQPVCKGRLWKLWIQTKQNWIKTCATLHNEDYVSQSPHNRKISTCKILPHPNIKTGLPDRVGAHLTCRTGSEPKVQIWMCQERIKIRAIPNVRIHAKYLKIYMAICGQKGKALGFASCSTSSTCGEADLSKWPCMLSLSRSDDNCITAISLKVGTGQCQ